MENSSQPYDVSYDKFQLSAMKVRIEELLDKVTVSNVQQIADELLKENLIEGRGLFCQAMMKSQKVYPKFSNVYASLVAIINVEFPDVGRLLVKRVALQFKEAAKEKKNEKELQDTAKFIAHLVNQRVVFAYLALDVILTILTNPNSDNIKVAVNFCVEIGSTLQVCMPDKLNEVFEEFGGILRKGKLRKGVQVMMVKLFAIKKSEFRRHPDIIDELDLVEPEDQITHDVSLLHDIDPENSLDDSNQEDQLYGDNEEVSSQVLFVA